MVMVRLLGCLLVFLCAEPGWGACESAPAGGRSAALAGAVNALRADLWAGAGNPAGLAGIGALRAGCWITPSLFGIPGLTRAGSVVAFPWSPVTLGIGVSSFGWGSYREISAAFSVAGEAGPSTTLGARLLIHRVGIDGYGSAVVPAVDAGILLELSEGVAVASHLTNIGATGLGSGGETLPVAAEVSCAVTPAGTGLTCFGCLTRELQSPLELRAGVEYVASPGFALRAGIVTEPWLLCAGVGVVAGSITFDYAVTHHRELGPTHHLSACISFE